MQVCSWTSAPTILILGPILAPLAVSYGVDPIHFGLIVVFILAMGQATPPFGTCLFVACGLSDRPFSGVGKSVLPFVAVELACGFLFTYVPVMSTFLPSLLQ